MDDDCIDMDLAAREYYSYCEGKLKTQAEKIKKLEVELKELRELRIIFDDDSALRHVVNLREEIKGLKEIINRAIDGIEALSVLDSWPEGQMKKDVMAIKETLEK